MGQDKKTRKQLANRASALRKKKAEGNELTIDEAKELAEWDARKNPRMGRTPKYAKQKKVTVKEGDAPAKVDKVESGELPSSGLDQTREPTQKPPTPSQVQDALTPPKPPEVITPKGTVGGDWRAKYGGDQMSREQACTMGAKLWVKALCKMNEQIREAERKPFLDDEFLKEDIYNACVLTIDALLPPDFSVTPQVTAAAGTTVVLTQRAYVAFVAPPKKPNEPVLEAPKEAQKVEVIDKQEKQAEAQSEKHRVVDDSYTLQPGDLV